MKFLKGLVNILFYPLNFITSGKNANKLAEFFANRPSLIFFVALIISSIIYFVTYFVI